MNLDYLMTYDGVVGWDIETADWEPGETPYMKARPVIMSFATKDHSWVAVRDEILEYAEWLESPFHFKTGHKVLAFDTLAVRTLGIHVRGLIDTLPGSRLLNPTGGRDHDLKQWGKRLGYDMIEFKEFLKSDIIWYGPVKSYKRDRVKDGVTYTAGAEFVDIDFNRRKEHTIDEILDMGGKPRDRLLRYAELDAIVALKLYHEVMARLERVRWDTKVNL